MAVSDQRRDLHDSRQLVRFTMKAQRAGRNPGGRAVTERSPRERMLPRGLPALAGAQPAHDVGGGASVVAARVVAIAKASREALALEALLLEQPLGEHDHRLGVLGVAAAGVAEHLANLPVLAFDARSAPSFDGPTESIADRGAEKTAEKRVVQTL